MIYSSYIDRFKFKIINVSDRMALALISIYYIFRNTKLCLTDGSLILSQWCYTPATCWHSLLMYYGVVVCSSQLIILDFPTVALMICLVPAAHCLKNKDGKTKLSRRSKWSQSCIKKIGRMVEMVHFRRGPT